MFLRYLLLLALLYPSELYPVNWPWYCPPGGQTDKRYAMPTNQQMQILSTIGNMVPRSRFPSSSFVQSNPFMSGSPCNVIMLSTDSGQIFFQKNQNLCHLLALKNSKTIQLGRSVIAPMRQYPFPLNGLSINPFFSNLLMNQLLRNYLLKNYFLYNYPNRHGHTIPSQIVIGHPDVNLLGTSGLQDILLKLNIWCSGERICIIDVGEQDDKIFTSDRPTAINLHRFDPEVTTTDEDDTKVMTGNNERQLKMENPENTTDADPFIRPMENPHLFEGDIIGVNSRESFNAITQKQFRWPNGTIPYSYESGMKDNLPNISQAMKHIEQNTCIKFELYDGNQPNFVYIFYGDGCDSHLGMKGGNQTLSLGDNCGSIGIILHELLHASGFDHEHIRSDRDDYLIVYKENVQKGYEGFFDKLRPDQNRLINAFDYDSIMLYGETTFSKDGIAKTIVAKKPGIVLTGARGKTSLSPSDIERINILYECPNKNGTTQ